LALLAGNPAMSSTCAADHLVLVVGNPPGSCVAAGGLAAASGPFGPVRFLSGGLAGVGVPTANGRCASPLASPGRRLTIPVKSQS